MKRRTLDIALAAAMLAGFLLALPVMYLWRPRPHGHQLRGTVVRVVPGTDTVVVAHQAVAGLMSAMSMPFRVKSGAAPASLHPGDIVEASLTAGGGSYDLEDLRVVGSAKDPAGVNQRAPSREAERAPAASPGTAAAGAAASSASAPPVQLPGVRLLDSSGHRFRTGTLLGGPVAMAFLHTRCANPDACPRLARLLTETQELIGPPTELRGRAHLLTVTLDPGYDTPARLARYGRERGADPDLWVLATGDSAALATLRKVASLAVHGSGPRLTHGEVLLVFRPGGRLYRRFEGLKWTAQELAAALEEAEKEPGRGGAPPAGKTR